MSDVVIIAIVTGLTTAIPLVVAQLVSIWLQISQARANQESNAAVAKDVEHVKVATNSMKDALIAAALMEGEVQGIAKQKAAAAAEAVTRAEGVIAGRNRAASDAALRAEGNTGRRSVDAPPTEIKVDTMNVDAKGDITIKKDEK